VNGHSPSDYPDYASYPAGEDASPVDARFTLTQEYRGTSMDFNPETIIKNPFAAGFMGALVSLRGVPGASKTEKVIK